jgi:hypothetical protein
MDHIIYQKLLSKNIPTVLAEDLVSEKHFLPPPSEATFGVPEFAKLTRLKLHILLPLMKFYNVGSILFSDVDIGFTNNSLFSYLDDIPQEKEIAIASDDMNSLETLCSCFFLIRNTKRVIQLFENFRLISNEYNEKKLIGERGQQLLNAYVRHKTPNMKDVLFNLPMGQFPNGQALLDEYPTRVNMVPWIIHANFLVGSYSKICFLKKYNVWFLEYSWWYPLMSLYENIRFISYGVATFFGFKMIHD